MAIAQERLVAPSMREGLLSRETSTSIGIHPEHPSFQYKRKGREYTVYVAPIKERDDSSPGVNLIIAQEQGSNDIYFDSYEGLHPVACQTEWQERIFRKSLNEVLTPAHLVEPTQLESIIKEAAKEKTGV